ncbi:large ribosomal subunit protein uL15m-like [Amphiura filiformis]|uniref:large ribosomal subunit protein uL15m-like n=1 Tax=Amphiura filiformis TaxID=82378 RepID=UPI003B21290D
MAARKGAQYALETLRNMPRFTLSSLKGNPGSRKKRRSKRGTHGGDESGRGKSGQISRGTRTYFGHEGGATPFYIKMPKYPFNVGHHLKREYMPVSLEELQYYIDVGRINPEKPIDVNSFINAGRDISIWKKQYGIQLTHEGADLFQTQVNIEVQHASELTIAAVERNRGVIRLGYYDPQSLDALCYPLMFFNRGKPIKKRATPPKDILPYYMDPEKRGYLADPDKVQESREALAEKYGYALPDLASDPKAGMLQMRKNPLQIFFGLEPGWVVNLRDRTILKPTDEDLKEYYRS